MTGSRIELHHADADDSDALLEWRNDPATVEASMEGAPVARTDHEQWFTASMSNPLRTIYIATDAGSGTRVGMCRLDRRDVNDHEAVISINIAPAARGRGLGRVILEQALAQLKNEHASVRVLRATVKATNEASVRLFTSAGFSIDATTDGLHSFSRVMP